MSLLNFPNYQFSHLNFEVLLLKNVPKKWTQATKYLN